MQRIGPGYSQVGLWVVGTLIGRRSGSYLMALGALHTGMRDQLYVGPRAGPLISSILNLETLVSLEFSGGCSRSQRSTEAGCFVE
jgi:hypothetical protein